MERQTFGDQYQWRLISLLLLWFNFQLITSSTILRLHLLVHLSILGLGFSRLPNLLPDSPANPAAIVAMYVIILITCYYLLLCSLLLNFLIRFRIICWMHLFKLGMAFLLVEVWLNLISIRWNCKLVMINCDIADFVWVHSLIEFSFPLHSYMSRPILHFVL